jgi:hypothetical protein
MQPTGSTTILATRMGDLRRRWADLDIEDQRAVFRSRIENVVIHPATVPRGSHLPDPDRIQVVPVDQAAA